VNSVHHLKAAMYQTAKYDLRAHRTADTLGSRLAVAASPFGVGGRTTSSCCIAESEEVRALLVRSVVLGLAFGLILALLMRLSLFWGI
jgi:hypothetical protein